MKLITKESAFKIFYYFIVSDGKIASEEIEKLEEIGIQLFGDYFSDVRASLVEECKAKISFLGDDQVENFDILSENIVSALNDSTEDMEKGIPARMLIWNLMIIVYSDGEFDQFERRLMRKISRNLNIGDSVLFEMEQYIKTVRTLDGELDKLKDSMDPYKIVRPIVDELENRRDIIKLAAIALINDELNVPVEKLTVQDDVIDKAQAAIKEKTDPMMKKVNEQADRVLSDVKKAAAPVAAEAGKKIGKAFMGFGSKLINRNSSDTERKE